MEFILATGKVMIYRTLLQIIGEIDFKQNDIKSKIIVPLDEYLGINKLPLKFQLRLWMKLLFGAKSIFI